MKILWLSNRKLSEIDTGGTGSWLYALAKVIITLDYVQFGNITSGAVSKVEYYKVGNFEEWLVPIKAERRNGLPRDKFLKVMLKLIIDFNPDLVHVWGVESYWGYLTQNLTKEYPVLIEIQGLKKYIAPVYGGELTIWERFKCIGIKEILKLDTIFHRMRKYKKWGIIETQIIRNHSFFSTHSTWAESKVKEMNPTCVMYKNERMLRPEFYSSKCWEDINSPIIYTSLGYPAPFKGLLTLVRAIEILIQKHHSVILYVAGRLHFEGIRRDGYIQFLHAYIREKGLLDYVRFVGPLNGAQIIELLQRSSVAVFPSYVESYGLVLAECMAIGVPLVAAFNGGYSYLGKDNETVLFFEPGDAPMCAFQIEKLLANKNLATLLSVNGRKTILKRNSPDDLISKQIMIYNEVINAFHKGRN